jgi:adenylate kinase
MRKFVIMGVPGCGKGTQSDILKAQYDLVHISVGDILRWNIQNHTKLAARIKKLMSTGRLIPDEFVEKIVSERLEQHDWNYGFILDGFPRNVVQAEFFLESYDIDAVIFIDLPDSEVKSRILSRRICGQCNKVYNLINSPPIKENTCDACGSYLTLRSDDNERAIQERLDDYRQKTVPAIDLFKKKELVITVDGSKSPADVQSDIQLKVALTKYRIKKA